MNPEKIESERKRSRPIEKTKKMAVVKRNKAKVGIILVIIAIVIIAALAVIYIRPAKNRIAVIDTSMGTIRVELYEDKAPITAGNFINLSKDGFYDGLIFHRVIRDFMIQGGDPNGDGTGGPGYTIKDEFHPDLSNVRGTISMANSGPNTGGSQFFINVADNTYLDYYVEDQYDAQHAVFGRVISGMDVVDEISKVSKDSNDKPLSDIIINSITIEN